MSQFMEKYRAAGGDVEGVMERFMSDEELLKMCLSQFVQEDEFGQLRENILNKEYKKAFDSAHALKGITGNLGLTDLYEKLCILVEDLRGEKYDCLQEQLAEILALKEDFWEKYKEME